jgi:hypothetical protein
MFHAVGYSLNPFDAADPGRLCRGRERWIEPFDLPGPVSLHRLVVTGASFTDDSARDALRGLPFCGVPVPELLDALFPGASFVAFMEDGHPADIPEAADRVEVYLGHRAGGRVEEPMVRWTLRLSGVEALRALFGERGDADHALGLLVLPHGAPSHELPDGLLDALFLLTGMSTLDSPPARFQPAALGDVLAFGPAVALVHRDKHGPALGIYTRDPLDAEPVLAEVAAATGALVVPFAIPPMLARWDRAIAELRHAWMAARADEFPVPPAPEAPAWGGRRGDRRGDRRRAGRLSSLAVDPAASEGGDGGEE